MTRADQPTRAIRACHHAGLPVVNPGDCTCALRGRLVVLAWPGGLRVVWPYEERCRIHGLPDRAVSQPAAEVRAQYMETADGKPAVGRSVSAFVQRLAAQLDAQFGQDAALASTAQRSSVAAPGVRTIGCGGQSPSRRPRRRLRRGPDRG